MILKTLKDVAIGETVFRYFGSNLAPMLLQLTAVTEDRIICGGWEFDKKLEQRLTSSLSGARHLRVPTYSPFHFRSKTIEEMRFKWRVLNNNHDFSSKYGRRAAKAIEGK